MAATNPELLDHLPSDTLRKLRAQLIVGDITDRVSAITSLLTHLVDKEIVHEARVDRDKKAAEVVAKAQDKAQDARKADQKADQDDDAPQPPSVAGRPAAGATARR